MAEANCEKDIAIDIRNPNENDEFYDENNDFYDEGSFETMALGKRFYSSIVHLTENECHTFIN